MKVLLCQAAMMCGCACVVNWQVRDRENAHDIYGSANFLNMVEATQFGLAAAGVE